MIGLLRGRVVFKQPPFMTLDVNGVGYELEAPMSTFYDLPAGDEAITLHTHLAIREDAHVLYAFAKETDKRLFRALLKINGVGGKMALAILSNMSADEFSLSVQAGDTAAMTRIPGVGKKTAERLIIEMRDRLEKLQLPAGDGVPAAPAGGVAQQESLSADGEAVSALIALGYKPAEASRMVRSVDCEGQSTENIIRAALQSTVKK